MMPQRMIILKHRRNRAGRHKTGCPSLRHRKKVYRTSYTLVERCLTRTSQISFESQLFTSYVNDYKLIQKTLSKFPDSSPITFTIRKLEKDRAVSLPRGVLLPPGFRLRSLALTSIPYRQLLFCKGSNHIFLHWLQRSVLRNKVRKNPPAPRVGNIFHEFEGTQVQWFESLF